MYSGQIKKMCYALKRYIRSVYWINEYLFTVRLCLCDIKKVWKFNLNQSVVWVFLYDMFEQKSVINF